MHQNTLPSPKTFSLRVLHTASVLRIESQDGSRKCIIDLTKMDNVSPSPEEQRIVYGLEDAPMGIWRNEELTLEECRTLGGLRDRINKQFPPAPPTPVPPPTPTTVPSVPAPTPTPAPVNPTTAVRANYDDTIRSVAGALSGDAATSGGRIVTRKRRKKGEERLPGSYAHRISSLERAKIIASEGFTILQYDLPQKLTSACPNPSRLLWGFGFRMTLSVWILPSGAFECEPIQRLIAHWESYKSQGVVCRVLPAGEMSAEHIKQICNEELSKTVQKAHTSLIANIDTAAKKLEEARAKSGLTEKELALAQSAHDGSVRNYIRNAADLLQNSIQLAEMFDLTEDTKALVAALRSATESQAQSFNSIRTHAGRQSSGTIT